MNDVAIPHKGQFAQLLDQLRNRGLPIPAVLANEARPLALSTRQDLQPWGELNGYDEDALRLLNRAVGVHVRSAAYQHALVADLSERFDLDGNAVGKVSELDRHGAALLLFVREAKDMGKRAQLTEAAPKPKAPGISGSMSSPSPSPAAQKAAPVFSDKPLSVAEIETRRQALRSGLLPQRATTP